MQFLDTLRLIAYRLLQMHRACAKKSPGKCLTPERNVRAKTYV